MGEVMQAAESFRGASTAGELWCAMAHLRISRFRVRSGARHRAALRADPLGPSRNDELD